MANHYLTTSQSLTVAGNDLGIDRQPTLAPTDEVLVLLAAKKGCALSFD